MGEIFGQQDEQAGVALLEPSVPRATLEDGETIEPRSTGSLQAGSHARIYRDGQILEGMVLVPQESRMSLRHLAPGSYVLRDECDNEVAVRVGVDSEDAVVFVKGGEPGADDGTAEPGSAVLTELTTERDTRPALSENQPGFPNVGATNTDESRSDGGDMIRPDAPGRKGSKLTPEQAERDDVITPAEPGSARITPEKAVTTDEELPDDAARGVITEPTDQGEDPQLENLAITDQEREIARHQKAEKSGASAPVDSEAHSKEELRALAKQEGVTQGGSKSDVAARINEARAKRAAPAGEK